MLGCMEVLLRLMGVGIRNKQHVEVIHWVILQCKMRVKTACLYWNILFIGLLFGWTYIITWKLASI